MCSKDKIALFLSNFAILRKKNNLTRGICKIFINTAIINSYSYHFYLKKLKLILFNGYKLI